MATNHTTNYQLNQWEPADAVQRVDFNADNAKLDSLLSIRNCQLYTMFYVGTGSTSRTLTFPKKPMLIVGTNRISCYFTIFGASAICEVGSNNNNRTLDVTWLGYSCTWTGDSTFHLDYSGQTYQILALLDADT